MKREKTGASIEGFFIGYAIGSRLKYIEKAEITEKYVKDAMEIQSAEIKKEPGISIEIIKVFKEQSQSGVLDIDKLLKQLNTWYNSIQENDDIQNHYNLLFKK